MHTYKFWSSGKPTSTLPNFILQKNNMAVPISMAFFNFKRTIRHGQRAGHTCNNIKIIQYSRLLLLQVVHRYTTWCSVVFIYIHEHFILHVSYFLKKYIIYMYVLL
jgi:hypothetical protein